MRNLKDLAFLSFALILAMPAGALCTTYYLDFGSGFDSNAGTSKTAPWKRAPGMAGFAGSYSHTAGDQFIFKGGVTWDKTVFNWTISNSGSSTTPDYYGVDKTWYSGASWSQPIFDGGGAVAQNNVKNIHVIGSFVTLDNLKIQNLGLPYIYNGGHAISIDNNHDVTIQHCTITPNARIGILISDAVANTTMSNFTVSNNDISAVSWGVAVAPSATNAVMSNVLITNNALHDFTSQMCGGVHGDGIIMYRGNYTATSGNYISSAYISGNRFYGDFHVDSTIDSCVNNNTAPSGACTATNPCGMNSFLYVERPHDTNTYVYNNSATYANVLGWHGTGTDPQVAMIQIREYDLGFSPTFHIYNNSFQADGNTRYGVVFSLVTSLELENNIISGTQFPLYPIDLTSCNGMTADYNDYYGFTSGTVAAFPSACGGFQSWSQYHLTNGKELHSLNLNPLFISSTNLGLATGSPAFGSGLNLSTTFTTDAMGIVRPSSGAWDLGAYTTGTTISSPQNLRILSIP